MGENVADWLGISKEHITYWPSGGEGANYQLANQSPQLLKQFDDARLVLFASHCGVHSYYTPEMVRYWQEDSYHVIAHPECRQTVVSIADSYGSTAFIWDQVTQDRAGTKQYAIATENHLVENLKQHCKPLGIRVVNVGEANLNNMLGIGCGCATMSRNDPPHLAGVLDLLRKGKSLDYNRVKPGDVVNEFSGTRNRLDEEGQIWIAENAKKALDKMIEITKS